MRLFICHCEARSAVAISVEGTLRLLRGVYTERCEILRYAQNDRKSEVLPQNDRRRRAQNDRCGGLAMTVRNC
jgi:hypothetical protein